MRAHTHSNTKIFDLKNRSERKSNKLRHEFDIIVNRISDIDSYCENVERRSVFLALPLLFNITEAFGVCITMAIV